VRIDILFVPDCPNVDRARERLHQALGATAVEASVTETEVATLEQAIRARMAGSPTVLLDGRDPFPTDGTEGSLGCRLYRSGGRSGGAPSVAQFITALTATYDSPSGRAGELGNLLAEGLDDVDRALAVTGFAALWDHKARRPEDLVPGVGGVGGAAVSLAGRGRAEVDGDGAIVGIHGLTLRPTRHHFVHRGHAHRTWCAFDSIGIPAALSLDAVAHTDCPSCQRPLTVLIREGVPESSPAVLWLPGQPSDNLMAQFCSCADLYCSLEHLRQRIDPAATPGAPTDLAAAADLGRQTWADVTGLPLGRGS
jgi:hypothetical protein